MLDEGFLGTAIWFLVGFFIIPWVLRFGFGFVAPFVGLGGAMFIYAILGIQAVAGLASFKWHHGLAIGLLLATAKDILGLFVPLPF